ncbi:MAG: hypothetical protein K2J79_04750 [Ruminiclostridium sp.]|nr:hypothetical protein [Ruminiclostridium sp.]
MKPKHFLLIIPAALFVFAILYLIIVIVLIFAPWGEVRPRAFPFGIELTDDYVRATVYSSDFTEKINVSGTEISAPQDNMYMILDMELTAVDGKWDIISDFTIHRNDLDKDVSFDREATSRLNDCDLLKLNSSEKQSVKLAFILPKSEQLTGYTMTIQYANGACSEDFALCSLEVGTATVQA